MYLVSCKLRLYNELPKCHLVREYARPRGLISISLSFLKVMRKMLNCGKKFASCVVFLSFKTQKKIELLI